MSAIKQTELSARLRGHAGLDDFLEFEHIAFKPGKIRH